MQSVRRSGYKNRAKYATLHIRPVAGGGAGGFVFRGTRLGLGLG